MTGCQGKKLQLSHISASVPSFELNPSDYHIVLLFLYCKFNPFKNS